MQGQFQKNFPRRGEDAGRARERGARDARSGPRGRAPRAAALPPPSPPVPLGHSETRRPPFLAFRVRPATRAKTIQPPSGPLLGPKAFRSARPLQNHAGLRGWAGNPRARRNWRKQNRRQAACVFREMRGMDGQSGFSPVIRHGFEMAPISMQ